MGSTRLEAFSDGVIAILITIMILELKVPHGTEFSALVPVLPNLGVYLLSFVFLGIYWNNHHHMLHLTDRITGGVLWANLHLLFWLSLVPFVTAWMGENHFAAVPTAVYGAVLLLNGVGYYILERVIIAAQEPGCRLEAAVGKDRKGVASVALYALAIVLAFVHPAIAIAIYVVVALMWLVPDPRIEAEVRKQPIN